jgi:hypothetical protein
MTEEISFNTPKNKKQSGNLLGSGSLSSVMSDVFQAFQVSGRVENNVVNSSYSTILPLDFFRSHFVRSEAERQIRRLSKVRGSDKGWKGYNTEAPNDKSIDLAIETLFNLRGYDLRAPLASINAEGMASLFWSDEHLYADVEILPDGKVEYRIQIDGKEAIDDCEEINQKGVPEKLFSLLARAYFQRK